MICDTCATGKRYWFDLDCPVCMARHYTLVLGPKPEMNDEARRRALDTQYKQKERLRQQYDAAWIKQFEAAVGQ